MLALSTTDMRVLICGVGYDNLRDSSLGPVLIEQLRTMNWPVGFEFEDLSYGPIGIMHNLDSRVPYDRLVLVAGVKRGRRPGSVHAYRWGGSLPNEEEVQARVAEAVTGVVSLDNLLIIGTWFRKLPSEVFVVEVEVEDENWGSGFSEAVTRAIPMATEAIKLAAEQSVSVPCQ